MILCFFVIADVAWSQYYSPILADTIFEFRDKRDGNKYQAAKIGDYIWMGENLRYKMKDTWCYDHKELNCDGYGRLYEWDEAIRACPDGWHLPSNEEWNSLLAALGGEKKAGYGLAYDTGLGMNVVFGFPPNVNGRFNEAGSQTNFWSSTENNSDTGWSYYLIKNKLPLVFQGYFSKNYNMSCRCVKDDSTIPE